MKRQIAEAWEAQDPAYRLTIETEVFWRRGGPPDRETVRAPEGR